LFGSFSANRRNQRWSGEAVGYCNVTPQQLADLRAGRWYMDVHTHGRPNGEIRGQIAPLSLLRGPNIVGTPPNSSLKKSAIEADQDLLRMILDQAEDNKWYVLGGQEKDPFNLSFFNFRNRVDRVIFSLLVRETIDDQRIRQIRSSRQPVAW